MGSARRVGGAKTPSHGSITLGGWETTSDEVRLGLADLLMVTGEIDRVEALVVDACPIRGIDRRRRMIVGERALITGVPGRGRANAHRSVPTARRRDVVRRGPVCRRRAPQPCPDRDRPARRGGRDRHSERSRPSTRSITTPSPVRSAPVGTVQICRHDLPGAMSTLRRAIAEADLGRDKVRMVHLRSDLASASAMAGDVGSALDAMLAARTIAGRRSGIDGISR